MTEGEVPERAGPERELLKLLGNPEPEARGLAALLAGKMVERLGLAPSVGEAVRIRRLASEKNRTYETYKSYIEEQPGEAAANALLCLIHQANYLLDQQLRSLERAFVEEEGFSERLYRARSYRRGARKRSRGTGS